MPRYGSGAALGGAATGVARAIMNLQQQQTAEYYRRREARAQMGLKAAEANPAVLNNPEMLGFLTDYYGIPENELRSLFPTPEQRLTQAIPGVEAAAGLEAPTPTTKTTIQHGVVPASDIEAGRGLGQGMNEGDVEELRRQGISVSGDTPTVTTGPVPTAQERLGRVTQNLPPGYSVQYDPASGAVKLSVKGPNPPSKEQQDSPAVMRMFQNIAAELDRLQPGLPDYQLMSQAAELAIQAAAENDMIPPKYLTDLAQIRTHEQAQAAIARITAQVRLENARAEGYERAVGTEAGKEDARAAAAAAGGLRGGAGSPTPGAGAPPPRGEGAATGPSGSALNQPRQPGATRASGRFDGWAEGYDAPPPDVPSQPLQKPSQNGYIIGDTLTDNDLNDAAGFGLVIMRDPTGRFTARKPGEIPPGAIAERPEILLDRRIGFKMMDKKTTQQTNAAIVRQRIDNIRKLGATKLLVSFGASPEEVAKNPTAYLGRAASAYVRGQFKGRAGLVALRMAGDKRAIALAALETLVTPAVKALGDVGQITEPDKAPIRGLLQKIWEGTATQEQADATLNYLDGMMTLLGSAPSVSPTVAAMIHNADPMNSKEVAHVRQSVTQTLEAENKLRPGQLESDAWLRENGLLGGEQ